MRTLMRLFGGGAMVALLALLSACGALTGSNDIAALETQNAQLQGTIQMYGTPALTMDALAQAATQNAISRVQLTESAVELLAAQATLTVLQLAGGGGMAALPTTPTPPPPAVPADGQLPSPAPPQSPAAPQQTHFTDTVVATGRDDLDCPLGINTTFPPTVGELLVNTRIDYLPAGSRIAAKWYANGELYFDDANCWTPTQTYENICAYCSIAPNGPNFAAGNWTVELYLNGQLMAQTQFLIQEAEPTAPPQQ